MFSRLHIPFILLLAMPLLAISQQSRKSVYVGIRGLDLVFKTAAIEGEYFIKDNLSLSTGGGYVFGRNYKSMQHVTQRLNGGFIHAGSRAYIPLENGGVQLGLSGTIATARNKTNVEIPEYYDVYKEEGSFSSLHGGFSAEAGRYIEYQPIRITFGLRFSMFNSRNDKFGYEYWMTGAGPAGFSDNAPNKVMNWSLFPFLNLSVKIRD